MSDTVEGALFIFLARVVTSMVIIAGFAMGAVAYDITKQNKSWFLRTATACWVVGGVFMMAGANIGIFSAFDDAYECQHLRLQVDQGEAEKSALFACQERVQNKKLGGDMFTFFVPSVAGFILEMRSKRGSRNS